MSRARGTSIPQVPHSGQAGLNRHLRRWLARELQRLQAAVVTSAAACQAERYRKAFHAFQHICLLLFHALSGNPSLRQSYDTFANCRGLVVIAGLARADDDERLGVSFSQFAASNTSRPAAFVSELIPGLVARVRHGEQAGDLALPADLQVIDSTFLQLSLKLAPWLQKTTRSQTRSGVRVQTRYAPAWDLPEHIVVSTRSNDYRGLDELVLDDPKQLAQLAGCTLVVDLGYYSHRRLAQLSGAAVHWVTRRLPAASLTVVADCPVQAPLPGLAEPRIAVLHDQRVIVGSSNNRRGAVLPDVRLVTARVAPLPKAARLGAQPVVYEVLTDRWDLTAQDVVQVYLWRWQIELFFRWLKSHLQMAHLLGHSQNAVELSVAIAIVTHLLLLLVARAVGLTRRSPSLLRRLAWTLPSISSADMPADLGPPQQLSLLPPAALSLD